MEAILQAHPDRDTARAARNVLWALQQPVRSSGHVGTAGSVILTLSNPTGAAGIGARRSTVLTILANAF